MANGYPTPSATATPSTGTPAPTNATTRVNRVRAKREPERSWDHQLNLDFTAVKREVTKAIKAKATGEKWLIKSKEEQQNFVESEIEKELSKRERSQCTTTARAEYPEKWESECENVVARWMDRLSYIRLPAPQVAERHSSRLDADRDDEEEDLPTVGIKREAQDDEEVRDDYASRKRPARQTYREESEDESDDSEESDDDSDEEEEEDDKGEDTGHRAASKKPCRGKKAEPAKSVACSRGLGLILGSSGAKGTDIGVDNIPKISKPVWVFKDGHLIVWPPIAGWPVSK